jgi:hypothetical protein
MEKFALHTVIIKKPYNLEEAKKISQDFIKDKKKNFYRETTKSYRFRNIAKTKFINKSFKTKKINKDISIVLGQLKPENAQLEGAGIKEIIDKPIKAVKEFFTPKKGYNNTTTKNLNSYGNLVIKSLQIVRTPIMSAIDKALNVVSFNKWDELKKEYNYDKLFHLALVANLGRKNLVIEKNEVINVNTSYKISKDTEVLDVNLNGKRFTTNEMLNKTLQRIGEEKFYLYDGFKFNCQVFVRDLLESQGLYGEKEKNFLFQDLEELSKKMPSLSKKIMRLTTDAGAVVNKITGQAKPKLTPIQEKEAEFWRQNQAIKNKLTMETNKANEGYMQERRKIKDEQEKYWNDFYSFLEKEGFNRNSGQSYTDFIKEIENTKGYFPFPNGKGTWSWKKTKDIPITLEDFGAGGKLLKTLGLGGVANNLLGVYNSSVKMATKPSLQSAVDIGTNLGKAVKESVDVYKAGPKGIVKETVKNVAKDLIGGGECNCEGGNIPPEISFFIFVKKNGKLNNENYYPLEELYKKWKKTPEGKNFIKSIS